MGQYDAVAARSLATITKKGGTVTFRPPSTQEIYNPVDDTWSGGAPAPFAGKAVQIDSNPQRMASRGLSLVNPVTLMVAAKDLVAPPSALGMLMDWASQSYAIRDVETVAPDGATPILYIVVGSG